jgi:hypothetical protein
MKSHTIVSNLLSFLLFLAPGLAGASASSLLLDFGPTAVAAAYATNSPGHTSGLVPNTQVSWNTGLIADTNSLIYGDGTAATGVSIVMGRSSAGVSTINFSDKGYLNGALAGSLNGGLYAGTSPVRDGIYGGSGGGNAYAIGVRIDGLAAGTYTVVIHGRNTSTVTATPERFYGLTDVSSGSFSFSTANTNALAANSSPPNTNAFVLGDNYNMLTLTVSAGQSMYLAALGTVGELRGFFNTVEIVPGTSTLPARISAQPPATQTVLQGMVAFNINAQFQGTAPVLSQWRHNGTDIANATNASLTLSNITLDMAGSYSLYVSNASGSDLSANSVLNVTPVVPTGELSNVWNLLPGDRYYVTSSATNAERGLAYNPATSNLLMACRAPSNTIVVLDSRTGAEKSFMDVTGIPGSIPNVGLGMSLIGVGDDGVVYVASVTANAGSGSFYLYQWPDDSPNNAPVPVFIGDPGAALQPNLRWGDNLAVRGAGANTQVLLAPSSGTNVALLRTVTGHDFQTEIPPAVIAVSGVPSAFALSGLAFGPGTNTFWGKTINGNLYLIGFDLNANTGAVLQACSLAQVPGSVGIIAANSSLNLLAGLSLENPDNVRLYGVSDLTTGPTLVDQALFTVKNANTTQNGTGAAAFGPKALFVLDSNNGIKAFTINTNAVIPARIISQPANQTVWETMASLSITAGYQGTPPVALQWLFNGTSISNATNSTLVLSNVTLAMAGSYSLFVSNAYGHDFSSNAVVTVKPVLNTAQMTNIWNLKPGDRAYLGTNGTERGIAFNDRTTNLLLVSRSPSPSIVVLDAQTGAEKYFMNVSGVNGDNPGVSLGLNSAAVAADGAVYGASVTVNASTTPFYLYRWPDDTAANPPSLVFTGDPAAAVQAGLRYGDTLAVRGSGSGTQVLLSPGSGTNVVLLRTTSGLDFQNETPPAVIAVSGVPSGFAQLGIAFGPGTNTFWAKTGNSQLYLVQFDLASNTGAVLYAYATNAVPGTVRGISVDKAQKFLAGVSVETPDNVRLYDVSDLVGGPVMRDQELFATSFPNTLFGGTASTVIGDNYVFALDSNNGIKAFLINTNYAAPLPPFSITSAATSGGANVILTWQSVAAHSYVVQFKDALSSLNWSNASSGIVATGASTSFTNTVPGSARFYRVQGQ